MRHLPRARREAQRLLREAGIKTTRVPVDKIAAEYAEIHERHLEEDIAGMLVPLPEPPGQKRWAIVLNENHSKTRKRFTLAHELGHLILHGYTTAHADGPFLVRFRDARSSDGSVREEIEANEFAAELLMPNEMLIERLRSHRLEYAPFDDEASGRIIKEIAKEFDVSKAALQIRLANLIS
jgi:hypothetical protein